MPGPFPGMDPWLESVIFFSDIHNTLVTYLGDALSEVLPDPYIARGATRVWVEGQRREPDVGVFDPVGPGTAGAVDVAATLSRAGLIAVTEADESEIVEEPYLEVRTATDDRLVSVIEVLSLANKSPGEHGRAAYRSKQEELLAAGVGLVEIDLLRGGQHTTAVSRRRLLAEAPGVSYHYCISGAAVGPQRFVSAVRMEDRLPPLYVPLDAGLFPVSVELQPLLDRCYDTRKYARQVKYDRPADPPLTPEQQMWAEEILKTKGLIAPQEKR